MLSGESGVNSPQRPARRGSRVNVRVFCALFRSTAVSIECDPLAIWRPARAAQVARETGQLPRMGPVVVANKYLEAARAPRAKQDLPAVRREGRLAVLLV